VSPAVFSRPTRVLNWFGNSEEWFISAAVKDWDGWQIKRSVGIDKLNQLKASRLRVSASSKALIPSCRPVIVVMRSSPSDSFMTAKRM
jgi:hypothetical protein